MDRIIKDGKVAVVYSPGFGSGWYTWARHDDPSMIFDPGLVGLVLEREKYYRNHADYELKTEQILAYQILKWPDAHRNTDLVVDWVPLGEKFRVVEYDGAETVELASQINWLEVTAEEV